MKDIRNKESRMNILGEFCDTETERQFRDATWVKLSDRIGKTVLLACVFFLIAGAAPFFLSGFNSIPVKLLIFRIVTAFWGILLYVLSGKIKSRRYLLFSISMFIIFMGVFESVEAVLTYRQDFEYHIPFILVIILISYLLFPLSFRTIVPASVLSSVSYITALGFFTPSEWLDLIQLSVFFIFANIMGIFIFVELSKNRRYRYLSYNEINKLYNLLNEEIIKKDEANRKLSVLAETDELTGIANRRKFFSKLENEFAKSKRYKRPLSLLMLDIDHFKQVNDSCGHDAGDKVIKEYIRICKSKLRQSDIIARIGGEEFSVILPETAEEGAFILAERIRTGIEKSEFNINNSVLNITSSCGIASADVIDYKNTEEFIKSADNALYDAKNYGRNKCCIFRKEASFENN